jgi:hypothetical protein
MQLWGEEGRGLEGRRWVMGGLGATEERGIGGDVLIRGRGGEGKEAIGEVERARECCARIVRQNETS